MRSVMLASLKRPLAIPLAFSLGFHAFVLFGIGFVLPDPGKSQNFLQPLEVVLVNSKSRSRPLKADALAQHNLDGGGNTTDNKRASSPLPNISDDRQFTQEQSTQRLQKLEQQVKKLITQAKSKHIVPQELTEKQRKDGSNKDGRDLMDRALEIARLEAQINRDFNAYQKMPQRKFIGASTQEYRYAQYIEDWRIKVERIGNLNYPTQARQQKIFGQLRLTVSIRSNGSVESVEVTKSSGQRILDAAAVRIVKLAAPYAPFPEDIRKDTDILSIVRTWTFTANDRLESD
ncbi:MAG TPA: energy transducer TonB [Gallionellaceae bacterium]|nr:energy transducer TonB [Gallionellaceae bacterium]